MKADLSKEKKIRTPAEAKAEFRRLGKSVVSWSKEHGFCNQLVGQVLAGKRPGHRGQTHRIAVLLGIKDGVIED